MIQVRKAEDRGYAHHGWLETHHTFSFAGYRDPEFEGFRTLRVLNEDRVAPGQGFGTHPHRDMEIVTYVVDGELRHRDSLGVETVIGAGELQRMSAGSGLTHSEFNASTTDPLHFLQIWILPEKKGGQPSHEEKKFPIEKRLNRLQLVASGNPRDGAMKLGQDTDLYAGHWQKGAESRFSLPPGRSGWVQMIRGEIEVNGVELAGGDGAAIQDESELRVLGVSGVAEALLFDLP